MLLDPLLQGCFLLLRLQDAPGYVAGGAAVKEEDGDWCGRGHRWVEVKPSSADGTALVTGWESGSLPG